ncbi:amino acid carrier protein [uncultured Marixanthomonas sp.]|uniref:amino acid carrier protein n=1 Tax=uncultured Marixanthomonas sp. TaxID=757245 RepID=UPI0030D960D1|tara:strand:- start:90688 stop:92787 length:2100 start_codon:yes stop_codon:yes gene_type:complete
MKYIKSLITPVLFLIAICNLNAQNDTGTNLTIAIELNNPSKEINDGVATIEVEGGKAPYQYKWSNQSTSLESKKSTKLIEGMQHSVVVTDAAGNTVSKIFKIPTESITETFNSKVQPAVDFLGDILFWDPFANLGIYDPVVYTEYKQIPIPNWEATTENTYHLKKWIVAEGELVNEGDEIAILETSNGDTSPVYAAVNGKLKYLVAEGNEIFNPNSATDVIEQGAHMLALVEYDEPQPLQYPNGDIKTNTIPFIVIWLILGSIFFTFRLGFVNIRGFKHSIDLARGKYDDPDAPGTITHFQAMATAVSATVGLGNIAGVAVAISLGGAGATFWMFMAGFFAMSLKFAECTLGVKYRIIENGRIFGGPMNYLRYGLEKRNLKGLGKFLAALFALLGVIASFGGGNMLQSNQAFKIVSEQLPFLEGYGFWFGVFFAVLVGVVIIGGINSIARVTGKVVPFMAIVYIVGCLVVIGTHIENIGGAFSAIFNGAFSADALKGGFIGVLIIGLQRAAFSSEAGVGSAAIAHSASKTNNPIADGFTSLVEPFIDTMVVCTMTALVLIFTGMHEVDGGLGGVELTSDAFGSVISWFPAVLAFAVFLFAFSTMVSWSYYGMRSWTYLFGRSKQSELIYKVMFLLFVVLGASASLGAVLSFSDMMILAMSFPNIIGLYIMSPEIQADMVAYWERLKKGELYISSKFKKA